MEASLAAAYARCRELHRRHGRTYYLATRLLPARIRPHVHALYGFARHADEIVDATDGDAAGRAAAFDAWSAQFLAGLAGAPVADPVLPAVLHTVRAYDLDPAELRAFLRSMAADLTVTGYARYTDLLDYMAGSAAAIGALLLPILGSVDRAAAEAPARQLGLAFQLTNFLRDVGEDLARGRVYLPQEDLDRYGVTRDQLAADAAAGTASPPVRALIAHGIGRARRHYAAAAGGIGLLAPQSRACVRAAYLGYGAILDQIAAAGHDVLARRAVVPRRRRVLLAARAALGTVAGEASPAAAARRASA